MMPPRLFSSNGHPLTIASLVVPVPGRATIADTERINWPTFVLCGSRRMRADGLALAHSETSHSAIGDLPHSNTTCASTPRRRNASRNRT
jgi:hypothetical protein